MGKTRVLVIGATGMLGNSLLRFFAGSAGFEVRGSMRSAAAPRSLSSRYHELLVPGIDVENVDSLHDVLARTRPDVVLNCVGLVKQLRSGEEPLSAIPINALLPHRLQALCGLTGSRLVHFSTDCVFSGRKGMYTEADFADADDVYGRSKFLGEVSGPRSVTLRTSIIGHELGSSRSLVDWFLSQQGAVKGYRRAVFSGLPTVEIGRVVRDHVLPHEDLAGVYHLSSDPIDKYELLRLIAKVYGHDVRIEPDDAVVIDRSLDSSRFRAATGYAPVSWEEQVARMHEFDYSR